MMFPTKLGAEEDTLAYLRPETAQGVYVNFLRQFNILRGKLPMGLAIVGKAFRNEISPRQLVIRQREFTQAELQIFFDPSKIEECEKWDEMKGYEMNILSAGTDKIVKMTCEQLHKEKKVPKFYVYHLAKHDQFYTEVVGLPKDKFRMRELDESERAFYN
ncbi:MAG: glycine--tRNA ligase, partial [Euryarchaeota archaeon]|nr:glycine--tRNA ligase [Euryarchaeota archaeon]